MLTTRKVRATFYYDPLTGVFRWKQHRCRNLVGRVAGCLHKPTGYWFLSVGNKKYKGHIVAWAHYYGRWPKRDLDHRDLNKARNAIENLRLSNKSTNGANRPKQRNNTSGYKGVYWMKRAKFWLVQVRVRNQSKYVGIFKSREKAALAYAEAATKYFGKFARAA